MHLVRSFVWAFHRGLRPSLTGVVIVLTAFVFATMALPSMATVHERSTLASTPPAHCHEQAQQAPTTGKHAPLSHGCCAGSSCACALGAACVAAFTTGISESPSEGLVIPIAVPSKLPLGLRSPLFRPPIP
jgi:hypothetical protein